jgi:hypothetical protein
MGEALMPRFSAAMMTARQWKAFYAQERESLGESGLCRLVECAPIVELPRGGALIFPHTKLRDSGRLPAAVARAVVASGTETVLAIGVLHGGREADAALVRAARSGDRAARKQLRRVPGPGAPHDLGVWTEEFSLDNFLALLAAASDVLGRPAPPRVLCRYPFLVGEDPQTLPGLDELHDLVRSGAAIVATTDPIHHGAGYGTPASEQLDANQPQTLTRARQWIETGLSALARHDYRAFLDNAERVRSDFRDPGPVLAELLREHGPLQPRIHELALVDYAAALDAAPPTWVAAALAELSSP